MQFESYIFDQHYNLFTQLSKDQIQTIIHHFSKNKLVSKDELFHPVDSILTDLIHQQLRDQIHIKIFPLFQTGNPTRFAINGLGLPQRYKITRQNNLLTLKYRFTFPTKAIIWFQDSVRFITYNLDIDVSQFFLIQIFLHYLKLIARSYHAYIDKILIDSLLDIISIPDFFIFYKFFFNIINHFIVVRPDLMFQYRKIVSEYFSYGYCYKSRSLMKVIHKIENQITGKIFFCFKAKLEPIKLCMDEVEEKNYFHNLASQFFFNILITGDSYLKKLAFKLTTKSYNFALNKVSNFVSKLFGSFSPTGIDFIDEYEIISIGYSLNYIFNDLKRYIDEMPGDQVEESLATDLEKLAEGLYQENNDNPEEDDLCKKLDILRNFLRDHLYGLYILVKNV